MRMYERVLYVYTHVGERRHIDAGLSLRDIYTFVCLSRHDAALDYAARIADDGDWCRCRCRERRVILIEDWGWQIG